MLRLGGFPLIGMIVLPRSGFMKQLDADLNEAVGRLLIVGFEGSDFPEVEDLILQVRPSGLIFFKRNYPGGPEALRLLIERAQTLAEKELGRRLFMAIDHEGGLVQRLPAPYTPLPSAWEAASDGAEPAEAARTALAGARELAATGFNFNMAPVLDVARPDGDFIGTRAFSDEPGRVSALGRAWLEAFHQAGLLGAAKHFPGLGAATADPHHDLPLIDLTLGQLEQNDLKPFRELIGHGLEAVMTTHALYPALDKDQPATFSGRIVALIKDDPSFRGAVLTDDLEMGAVVRNYPLGQAAVAAVSAGHDLALICRRRDYVDECRQALAGALESGRLAPERLADAHARSARLLARLEAIRPPAELRARLFADLLKGAQSE